MNNKRNRLLAVSALSLAAFFALTAESCDQPDTQQKESAAQDRLQAESDASVGMPNIVNWTEKRQLKAIIEKRDTPHLTTYTYLVGMKGEHVPLCRSEGYGFDEAEEFTNPQVTVEGRTQGEFVALTQADPNGLYSPVSSAGTWVLCLTNKGDVQPVRSEPNVITLPVPWANLNQDGM